MKMCPDCANTGTTLTGERCTCQINLETNLAVDCLYIPEQYRSLRFNKALVPKSMGEGYSGLLDKWLHDISTGRMRFKNMIICAPSGTSKSVFVYNCIEHLFKEGREVLPYGEVTEFISLLEDLDHGRDKTRSILFENVDPETFYRAPYMFVKVPSELTYKTLSTIVSIMERRVRRGLSTIFLYDGHWSRIANFDKGETLTGRIGDGSFNTLKVHSFDRGGK